MNPITVSLDPNQSLALSESRIKNFLEGKNTDATRMGWFDSIKDIFHGGAKQAALEELAKQFDGSKGLTAFDKFALLARFATPTDRAQFTVTNKGPHDAPELDYSIKGIVVKQDKVQTEQWDNIKTRLGQVSGLGAMAGPLSANWLTQYERNDLIDVRKKVQDSAFSEGGLHKRFDPNSGVLRAEGRTGLADFAKEGLIGTLASSPANASLVRYVSTQALINRESMKDVLPEITSDKTFATVTLYDKTFVESGELDSKIDSLSPGEAHSVLMQIVDMARVFYEHGISHQDLHMHNLMVHKPVGSDPTNITLKAIDFGKSKVNVKSESDRLNDVRYLFQKQASSGMLETLKRSGREHELPGFDIGKQAKHYPLHKLIGQCAKASLGENTGVAPNAFDESVKSVGDVLVKQLQRAETLPGQREEAINKAFNQAMNSLSAITDQLRPPPDLENHDYA